MTNKLISLVIITFFLSIGYSYSNEQFLFPKEKPSIFKKINKNPGKSFSSNLPQKKPVINQEKEINIIVPSLGESITEAVISNIPEENSNPVPGMNPNMMHPRMYQNGFNQQNPYLNDLSGGRKKKNIRLKNKRDKQSNIQTGGERIIPKYEDIKNNPFEDKV